MLLKSIEAVTADYLDFEIGLCWGTLEKANLPEFIAAAGKYGFPTLSIRPDTVCTCLDEGMTEASLRRRLGDARVRVRVLDGLATGLPGTDDKAVAVLANGPVKLCNEETCFRVAGVVECSILNISLSGGKQVPLERLAEAIGGVARRAARHGIDIVLEFVPNSSIPDIHAARFIAENCGEPNCRVLLDPWHLARSGGSLDDVLALPKGLIGAYQLDDRTPPAPGTPYVPMTGRDLPGEGVLPLHELTRAALVNNPGLTAEIEVFSEELRQLGTDRAAARAAECVRAWRAGL